MKNIIISFGLILFSLVSFAQTPQSFKYQGVVRDASNQLIANQNIQVRVQIAQDYPNGSMMYMENHTVQTNPFGVFNLNVFEGNPEQGNAANIDWAAGPYHLVVEVDFNGGSSYQLMGASELLAVPYALYGEDADADPINELQTVTKNGNQITLSNGGGTINLNDDSPSNEIQKLSKSSNKIRLSDNGGEVSLNDDDPDNELQKLTKSSNKIKLSDNGGEVTLKDDDPDNELQSLSFRNGQLSLSRNGGRINIPVSPFDVDQFGNVSFDKNMTLNGFITSTHWIEAKNVNAQTITGRSVAMDGGNTKLQPNSLHFNRGGTMTVNLNGRQAFYAGAITNPNTGQRLPGIILKTGTYEAGITVGQGGKIDARAQRMYAESFNQTSDGRFKTDVSQLGSVMDKVMQLEPKSYRFKTDPEADRQIGFIAQEVLQLFPDCVQYEEEIDRYTLSYTDFSVIAIKAIQEQQKEIQELKRIISKLAEQDSK